MPTSLAAPLPIRTVVRAREWWAFKIAPLLGVAYAEIALHGLAPGPAFTAVAAMLLCGACLGAFGHVVNDAFDVEADAVAGKPNRLAGLSTPARATLALALLGGAVAPWAIWALSPVALGIVAVSAALLVAYSAPPVRLKERGGWGLLADAGYAHVLPVLVVSALFGGLDVSTLGGLLWTGGLVVWALCFGVRGILLHQIWDAPADAAAGTSTFVLRVGEGGARRLIRRVLFPCEVASLVALGAVLAIRGPGPAAVAVGAAAVAYVLAERVAPARRGGDPAPVDRSDLAALVLFYAVWPPLLLGASLALVEASFAVLFVLTLVLFREPVAGELHHALTGARVILTQSESAAPSARPVRRRPTAPRRIALVLPDGLGLGGVTTWALRLAGRLGDAGHRITLLEHRGGPHGPRPDAVPDVPRVYVGGQRPFFPIEREVREYLPAYEGALPAVLVPNYTEGAYAACALLARDRPEEVRIVGIAHSDDDYYYGLLEYYQDAIHTFVAVSDEIEATLRACLPGRADDIVRRTYAVPCPERLDRRYAAPGEPLCLVYAGRMVEAQKRVGDFVPLVRHLLDRGVDFELTLVGDGPARTRLERRLHALGPEAAQRVRFAGRVPHQDMAAVWTGADVCVLVSDHEGCSISMLEAMAHGCVPVVTDVSGTARMLGDAEAGLTVPVGDLGAMADALARLGADRARLERMGRRAHATAASVCSWDAYTAWFADLAAETWTRPARPWPEARAPLYPPGLVGPRPVRLAARALARVPELYGPARRRYRQILDR